MFRSHVLRLHLRIARKTKFSCFRLHLRIAVKLNFPPYIQGYTSPNENFEYSYPLNVGVRSSFGSEAVSTSIYCVCEAKALVCTKILCKNSEICNQYEILLSK